MRKIFVFLSIILLVTCTVLLVTCTQKDDNEPVAMTPWGTVVEAEKDTTAVYSLDEIIESGELRALTIPGEDTYYTFDRAELGTHYWVLTQWALQMGIKVSVEVCSDTTEVIGKLKKGDGDIVMMPLPKSTENTDSLIFCGPNLDGSQWAVMPYNKPLADAIDSWYDDDKFTEAEKKVQFIIKSGAVQCHVYEPVLDRSKGVLSQYDELFKTYAPLAGTDWRLLAAICYQESCFDPNAHSWAGACGLMQIMPATAETIGLKQEDIFEPEPNVEAAAKLIGQLTMLFRDVPDASERMSFVLASYNGGVGHVRDAMALAEKYGENQYEWASVSEYILMLSQPKYYRDAVVKCGYMRGTETHDYVDKVRERYLDYSGIALGDGNYEVTNSAGYSGVSTQPVRRETKENKYQI